jgi:protein phosphatase
MCMHGGIGRSINRIKQIENLQRPIAMEAGSVVPMDLMWSVFELLLLSDYY